MKWDDCCIPKTICRDGGLFTRLVCLPENGWVNPKAVVKRGLKVELVVFTFIRYRLSVLEGHILLSEAA